MDLTPLRFSLLVILILGLYYKKNKETKSRVQWMPILAYKDDEVYSEK